MTIKKANTIIFKEYKIYSSPVELVLLTYDDKYKNNFKLMKAIKIILDNIRQENNC